MKPLGIKLGLSDGVPYMRVTPTDYAADKVWEAVREAIIAGWTVERFRSEAADAWKYELAEAAKHAAKEWAR